MEKGTLVEFRLHGSIRLAVADRPDGKKNWIVIDERGQAYPIKPQQVTYEVVGQSFKPADIAQFREEVQAYIDPSSLEVAWELLVEEGEAIDPPTLAQLLYSDRSPSLCYAAHCLLSEDKLYFKQKGDRYEPRSANALAEIKHQLQIESQRQQEFQGFIDRAHQMIAGETVTWTSSDRTRIEALERFAIRYGSAEDRESPQKPNATVTEILSALNVKETAQATFNLLVDLKVWSAHENLFLRQNQIPVQFSSKALDVVQRCLQSPPSDRDRNRMDLTHLKVYTIDDESTTEIDDGLSLETLPDGNSRLWVHIADPTRWLSPGDELDLEARRRGTTIYLPTGMISMFPTELATGPMSLNQGETCCALSFGVVLDEVGNVEDYRIHASLIKPTYRLTYDDVDELLELDIPAEPEIGAIAMLAARRKQWRVSQGAIGISMPEASIKVKDDEVTIRLLEDSQARQLVAEMMILAGEVAARYARDTGVPIPFRNQSQPELPPEEELLLLPAGPVRACAIRRCMPRSEMSTTPGRHASLGLESYTQVTSPIRRYTDLMTHFQIKAHLRGDPLPFSAELIQELMMSLSSIIQEAGLVERQTNRYWGLEFLRRHPDEVWQGLVLRWLREHDNLALVLLEELGLEMAMRFTNAIKIGDRVELKVTYADPRQDVIHFQHLIESPTAVISH